MCAGVTLGKRLETGCDFFISLRSLYLRTLIMSRKPEASGSIQQGPTKSMKTQEDGRKQGRNLKRILFEHRSTASELSQPVLLGGCQGCGNEFSTFYIHSESGESCMYL